MGEVYVDNSGGTLTALDLRGYTCTLSSGFTTSEGAEYSAKPPLTCLFQEFYSTTTSRAGVLTARFSCAGILNLMAADQASEDYVPESSDTDTIKDLIQKIAGDTGVSLLDCFSHCTAVDCVFDSEDALIDVFQPKDSFAIRRGESRLAKINELLMWTQCDKRIEADGKLHIFVPTRETSTAWIANTVYAVGDRVLPTTLNNYQYKCTTGGTSHATTEPTWPTDIGATVADGTVTWTVAYDYDYQLNTSGEHNFFNKNIRERIVIPNYIQVDSDPSTDDGYTGYAEDTDSSDLVEKRAYYYLRVASSAQATAVATAILAHFRWNAQKGSGKVPINVGAEIHDFVLINDSRESDIRVGNIGWLTEEYTPGKLDLSFGFGSPMQTGLAGIAPPGGSSSGGTVDLTELYNAVTNLDNRVTNIEEWIKNWRCPLEDYVFINADGDLCIRAMYGRSVKTLVNLGMSSDFYFGLMWAVAAGYVKFYTAGGTIEHIFGPDNAGHGKVGNASFPWGEINSNEVIANTSMTIPSEA